MLKLLLEWGRPSEDSEEGSGSGVGGKATDPDAASVVDVNAVSEAGPPLLWACGHGKESAVEMLLAHGADPNVPSEDGITALLTACAAGETRIVKMLTAVRPRPALSLLWQGLQCVQQMWCLEAWQKSAGPQGFWRYRLEHLLRASCRPLL